MYHYFGLVTGKLAATLALLHVALILPGSHAAAWLGASTPNAGDWIQAGIAIGHGGSSPAVYVERGHDHHQVSLREWPVPWSHVSHVRLVHHGAYWRVIVDGYRSRWVKLARAVTFTTLETRNAGAGNIALIDGRQVASR